MNMYNSFFPFIGRFANYFYFTPCEFFSSVLAGGL